MVFSVPKAKNSRVNLASGMARKIAVVGMGYVGIPVAALFADVPGFEVVGVQRRSERSGWKIEWLNDAKNPIGGTNQAYRN